METFNCTKRPTDKKYLFAKKTNLKMSFQKINNLTCNNQFSPSSAALLASAAAVPSPCLVIPSSVEVTFCVSLVFGSPSEVGSTPSLSSSSSSRIFQNTLNLGVQGLFFERFFKLTVWH